MKGPWDWFRTGTCVSFFPSSTIKQLRYGFSFFMGWIGTQKSEQWRKNIWQQLSVSGEAICMVQRSSAGIILNDRYVVSELTWVARS